MQTKPLAPEDVNPGAGVRGSQLAIGGEEEKIAKRPRSMPDALMHTVHEESKRRTITEMESMRVDTSRL